MSPEPSRQGFDVVADVGHHDAHSRPLGILPACARRLAGLPAFFVGVRCPIDVVMARRRASEPGRYVSAGLDDPVPAPVLAWQEAVHRPGLYDLDLDTGALTPEACADAIRARVDDPAPPSAFARLATPSSPGDIARHPV